MVAIELLLSWSGLGVHDSTCGPLFVVCGVCGVLFTQAHMSATMWPREESLLSRQGVLELD